MSIFGTDVPKIVSGSSSLVLYNSIITDEQWQDPDYEEQKSVLNGYKNFYVRGDYSQFTVQVNLFKYSDPTTIFQTLYAYNHKLVNFYPYSSGNAVKDANNNDVLFFISEIKPFLINTDGTTYDYACNVTFISQTYTDLGNTVI